jgi:hypothetical protein
MDGVIEWLLDGDVSIQYLTHRLLLGSGSEILAPLRRRIEAEGFGAELLSRRNPGGHWDLWYYQRKWVCTHYTLTDLKNLAISPACAPCREMVLRALDQRMTDEGGINFAKSKIQCDICVDGMFLDYAAYFCPDDERLPRLVQFILSYQNEDGGFGWDTGGKLSDPHTTICVLEGLYTFRTAGHKITVDIEAAERRAAEYLLERELFINGNSQYSRLSYPYRYRYDLLRALEYLALAEHPFDRRLEPALSWLKAKKGADGCWPLENRHAGREHFIMEELHKPSRFITLKALCILKTF